MQRKIITEIICGLLILLFVYTGLSKLNEHSSFRGQLGNMYLINYAAPVLSYALPLFELFTAVTLAVPTYRLYGLYISFGLLVSFTAYLIFMVLFETKLPCSCGGVIAKLSWQQHIFFNLFFMALSAAGIKLQRRTGK